MNELRDRQVSEREHFDELMARQGETWWGSNTYSGQQRLKRRARLLAQALQSGWNDPAVIELGCGSGAFTRFILEEMPELDLWAVDISPKAAAAAAERLAVYSRARFTPGDALALDRAENDADAVVGVSILHHLPLAECLREIYRVLRPGGLLWFSEPNMANPQILLEKNVPVIGRALQNTPDERAFFRRPMARALRAAGFVTIDVRPFDFLHPLVPERLEKAASLAGRAMERIPLIREIAGSLLITARKALRSSSMESPA